MLRFFIYPLLATTCLAEWITVPNPTAEAVDQNPIHENGCGPVSWLNAYRFSSPTWRASTARIRGTNQQQFNYLTRKHAFQFSSHVYMKRRWDAKNGIGPRDLLDACNDFHKSAKLSPLKLERLFLEAEETHDQLMLRTQQVMLNSLENGFPPILHLTRFEKRTSRGSGFRWTIQCSHYVTLYAVENTIADGTLKFQYIDPVGGRICNGTIAIPITHFYAIDVTNLSGKGYLPNPSLVVTCPETLIGQAHSASALVLSQMLIATSVPHY